MKKLLYKTSICFPLLMVLYCLSSSLAFSIPEVGLFFNSSISKFLIIVIIVVWLCCSPLRKSCCNGSLTELLFNLVPVELVLLFMFAQWHFASAVIATLLLTAGDILIFIRLRKAEYEHKTNRRRHRKYQVAFHRLVVLVTAVITFVPCILVLFVYGFQSPTYQAEEMLWEQIIKEEVSNSDDSEIDSSSLDRKDLWSCFAEAKWNEFSVSEKITIMQKLVDYESEKLGIPTIPLTAGMIGDFTLGAYDSDTNEMWINTEHLTNSSVKDSVRTICHETYHSMQWYLVSTVDWNNPAMRTSYFIELQDWADNQKNYKDAWRYGFEAYENQPLEVAAREYGETESQRILSYIE